MIRQENQNIIIRIGRYVFKRLFLLRKMRSAHAYDLWSDNYDDQPDNLILALDEKLFSRLTEKISIAGKVVLDIGCGTGRHWRNILAKKPAKLSGYDVSKGMLKQLQQKFAGAETYLLKGHQLYATKEGSCDVIISTLAVAHIPDLELAFREWNRVLKPGADIIITDFHPAALDKGGKRFFIRNKTTIEIKNYIYTIEQVKNIARRQSWDVSSVEEVAIDDSVKQHFENKQALQAFERDKGMLVIYGIHFKKKNAAI